MGLKSKQVYITDSFIHADIPNDKKFYVVMPRVFEQLSKNGHKKYFKFKKTLYGIRQSPRVFWQYMTKKLEQSGPQQ